MNIRNIAYIIFGALFVTACAVDEPQRSSVTNSDFNIVEVDGADTVSSDAGSYPISFTLDENQVVDAALLVKVVGGSATEGEDFTLSTDHVDVAQFAGAGSFTVDIICDSEPEGNEDIIIEICGGQPFGINDPVQHTIVIEDDDCADTSTDISGTYNTTITGQSTDGCCPDPITVDGEMMITDNGDGSFSMGDWSLGMYRGWYEGYGIDSTFVADGGLGGSYYLVCEGQIRDACLTGPFGANIDIEGSVDQGTGDINLSWINTWGDTAEAVLTKN